MSVRTLYICLGFLTAIIFGLATLAVTTSIKSHDLVEQGATWLAAAFAVVAAWLWFKASTISVPAPPHTRGVGGLMGGYLVSEVNGKRIDLHKTLELQSEKNAQAAIAATVSAILTAISLLAKALNLP